MEIAGDETTYEKEITMKVKHAVSWLLLSVLLAACAATRGAGDRQAAAAYFQETGQVDPTIIYGVELQEEVLSFLGRAQYLNGDYPQARQTLQKALSQHPSNDVARLYLGLTLYRLGDQKAALRNIQAGINGIYNWLDYNTISAEEFGQHWDLGGTIRLRIKTDLAMISSGNIDWPKLIADGERLGIRIVQEEWTAPH